MSHINNNSNTIPITLMRFAFLDYLRIFAFMSVLIGHKFSSEILSLMTNPTTHATLKIICYFIFQLTVIGGAGVVVFFLISGYIITHVLQTSSPKSFLIKRFFRIYPLYFLACLIYFFSGIEPQNHDQPLLTLIYRLLLIGDFTDTSPGLHGVEWTLRLELYFYLFMFLIRLCNIIPKKQHYLPWIYATLTLLLYITAPFPNSSYFNIGYSSYYIPVLFCGSLYYLYEYKKINIACLTIFVIIMLLYYFILTAKFHPGLIRFHFVFLAFLLFTICWKIQKHIHLTPSILLLSNLTYPMYLFHHWGFDLYQHYLKLLNMPPKLLTGTILILLFTTCYLLNRYVEKPCTKLGAKIAGR